MKKFCNWETDYKIPKIDCVKLRLGGCTWKIALKYKVKQSKKGKFASNYKASPIDFETQISPVDKPLRI